MIKIKYELVLFPEFPGATINSFVEDSLDYIDANHIERAFLSFNGWVYIYDIHYKRESVEEIVSMYHLKAHSRND